MGKCLVTTLPDAINGVILPKMGDIEITLTKMSTDDALGQTISFWNSSDEGLARIIEGNSQFYSNNNFITAIGQETELKYGMNYLYLGNESGKMLLSNKYNFTSFHASSSKSTIRPLIQISTTDLKYFSTSFTTLGCNYGSIYGSIENLSNFSNCYFMSLANNPGLYGDISSFKNLKALRYLSLASNTGIDGDIIETLTQMPALRRAGFGGVINYSADDISKIRNTSIYFLQLTSNKAMTYEYTGTPRSSLQPVLLLRDIKFATYNDVDNYFNDQIQCVNTPVTNPELATDLYKISIYCSDSKPYSDASKAARNALLNAQLSYEITINGSPLEYDA